MYKVHLPIILERGSASIIEKERKKTLNINCLVEFFFIFLRFCLCIFESDTVKSDCPVQIFRKMMKYSKITLLVLLFFWRY